ncbi:MAG: CopG family ribbon-helix-helix protein [Chloroflexota bacterium]
MINRKRVSVSVDPALLKEVDAFVEQHPPADRSKVFDEALALWYARCQDEAMRAQFLQQPSAEEAAEIADWREIQRAAATRLFRLD